MSTIPLVMGTNGPVATSPTQLRTTLIENVVATNPDYTANLPGTLIEDIASTDVAAMAQIDQARVDAINSVTPYGANAFLLAQMGAMFGIPQGTTSNTSVYVVISGDAGYVIPAGFLVSDGTYTYVIQDGGIIATDGQSPQLYAVANQSGTWAVPAGTVTQIVTSVPSPYVLTVTNPSAGIGGATAETVQDYRSRIMTAFNMTTQGTADFLTANLQNVPGVQARLVSVISAPTGWEVICGGGDPYLVAGAIYKSVLDLSTIVGSSTPTRNITVSVTNPPDAYTITYVNPPQQLVTIDCIWNTSWPNFTGSATINQLTAPALQSYINGIAVGQPINILDMEGAFRDAVSGVGPLYYLTALTFIVKINGIVTAPTAGTKTIYGDPESYFYAAANSVTVTQG